MVPVQAAVQIAFAVSVVAAAAALVAAALEKVGARPLRILAAVLWILAVAAWVVFAFEPETGVAIAAAGITVCALLAVGSLLLVQAARRSRRLDTELDRAQARLRRVVEEETAAHAGE